MRRTLLAGSTNLDNPKPSFIKQRLPKIDHDIQNEALELNSSSTISHSEVRVFAKKQNNQVKAIGIKSSEMLRFGNTNCTTAEATGQKVETNAHLWF